MHNLRKILFYVSIVVSVVLICLSLLSLIYNLPYWYTKVLDFPRLQYLILALVCLLLFVLTNKRWGVPSLLLGVGLVVTVSIHAVRILPYLAGEKEVPDARKATVQADNSVSILLANVLITNRQTEKLFEIVAQKDPDMLLVMEVNDWWVEQLQELKQQYPYTIEQPLDNAYGMALYSKLPLLDAQIKYFNKLKVPSFHARVVLPSGSAFMFHGMHPVAPVPSQKYPDNEGEKEVALLRVGEMVAQESLPSMVAGDYNDVSWSYTSRMFGNEGNLKNIRIGRGLFNSFNAKSLIMRWPLDHIFVTDEFAVLELERLSTIGSDHFPIYAELVLQEP